MKIDHKKTLDLYRAKSGEMRVLEVPPMSYLAVEGSGAPMGNDHQAALAAIYPVAYAMKFASKNELERDYVVPPLEGLWWADDMNVFTNARDKSQWRWSMLLMTPNWITPDLRDHAIAKAQSRGVVGLDRVQWITMDEGLCVQTLHIGSFDDETEVLAHMHKDVIPGKGFALGGRHHEIYLSDFRRVAPHKLRTILRQPVQRVSMSRP